MEFSPILALILSFGMILAGNALEGGHISSLLQPTAALIVFGGTIGATWLGATNSEVKGLQTLIRRVIFPARADRPQMQRDILNITTIVRRDGMLAVEAQLPTIGHPILRSALQALVDGSSGDQVKQMLERETDMDEHHGLAAAKLMESAGGYAPTIGILGAVLGLIHVMRNLDDPGKLGGGIAVAFVATIYGVGIANLVFLPLGGRLKKIVLGDSEDREMLMVGIGGIVAGANSRQMTEMLAPFSHRSGPKSAENERAA